MGSRVELFEQIRRDRDREGLSIRALAARHGVHRRAVRQALASPLPPVKRSPWHRPAPKLGAYRALIDGWLEADREAPRKQRHTAKRIWRRLVDEHGAEVAETTVRDYVRARKRLMGWPVGEVFIPQVHAPGAEAGRLGRGAGRAGRDAVDGASVLHARELLGRGVLQASLVETQQAFLELHAQAFEWFGGGFEQIRFDNLASAVKQVLKGRRRVESDRFVALRSHYLFCSQFTTPGIEGAHEKGGVEGEVGRFRRNHLVPVPVVADLAELNALLLAGCEADLQRRIVGRDMPVGEAWAVERPLLRPLPAEPFDATETGGAARGRQVAGHGPPEPLLGPSLARRPASAPGSAPARSRSATATGWSPATSGCTAGSAPAPSSITTSSCLRKPGGLEHSLALAQQRERGAWPAAFDELWAKLTARYGRSEARGRWSTC